MLKHVIRIEIAWIRCPLLLVVWPADFWRGLQIVPKERRQEYCQLAWQSFCAAWQGEFVPK